MNATRIQNLERGIKELRQLLDEAREVLNRIHTNPDDYPMKATKEIAGDLLKKMEKK